MKKKRAIVVLILGIILLAVGVITEANLKTNTWWYVLIVSGSMLIGTIMVGTINWLLRGKPYRWKLVLSLGIALVLVESIVEVMVVKGAVTWWLILIQWVGFVWVAWMVDEWVHTPEKQKSSSGD